MARKIKSVGVDKDAGTHDERLYGAALHPWRHWLRKFMLPFVRQETPWLSDMQKRIRTPYLDHFFLWTANLGTHTFFMIFLPILIWFGDAHLGRSIASLTAFGVFWSGFLKDFMCLPRPLSPPVHRLTMSKGAALEYGFPSTHSTNSISVALYFIAVACHSLPSQSLGRLLCIIGAMLYASSVVFGRIYCGMHSITDVIGGTILAFILYWVQWGLRDILDSIVTSDTYWVFLVIPLCLALVGVHPDPIERCPCFEDSVCFMGVLIGVYTGSWLCNNSEPCRLGLELSAENVSFGLIPLVIILIEVFVGVAMLFIWRITCKKVCYISLPPIYRVFNLPHRQFELGAKTYKSLTKKSINPVPSVLDLRGLTRSIAASEHVGIQSGIDLHEKRVAGCKYKDLRHNNHGMIPSTPPPSSSSSDSTAMLVVEDAPLRYDVDIVTKLIVYSGIGLVAVYPIPIVFESLFGGVP